VSEVSELSVNNIWKLILCLTIWGSRVLCTNQCYARP
jgi:hypothetical protein